jgi:hypothetical protein
VAKVEPQPAVYQDRRKKYRNLTLLVAENDVKPGAATIRAANTGIATMNASELAKAATPFAGASFLTRTFTGR